ncbi:allantoinase AllB [Blastococcus sp. LR1]|uniref:allantoinase AllB n=1 Tax=Blastococcus sp. LR1 TaxID=2877000 RepID=UPI001CCA2358|nr:allantoinase AllB [Blastococcus sp. LR1]MCA0145358.1 allantoinase AllB [Blastococcus sp. LR1]
MPDAEFALEARRIVVPGGERSGAVTVSGGRITAISDEPPAGVRTVRLDPDCVLLPGLVDSHVHVNEPGRTEWEGFATATAAAAAGGVTTIVDMPLNSIPATVDVAALETKRAATAGKLGVDVAFWGGAVPGNAGDLGPLHAAGVVGVKCFLLPSGVDEFPPLGPAELRAAMTAVAAVGGLLIAHAEDPDVIDTAPAPDRTYGSFLRSRPPVAETRALELLIATARETGCRVHVVHVSAGEGLDLIAAAKAEGLPVTAETCPHYLVLTAEEVPDGATQFKCCPPIRGAANRDRLWQGLADGTIGCVVSDHSPCTAEAKRLDVGDFDLAWGGIASLQLGLPLVWTEAARRGFAPADVVRWMAGAPAALTGLTDRGAIEVGRQADFCVLAPDESFVVDVAALRHRNPVTPYAGRELRGVVRSTWLRGEPVYDVSDPGRVPRTGRTVVPA